MKLNELTECPFCGSDEYYTTVYVYGTLRFKERYDGKEAENELLYDILNALKTKNFSAVYCANCEKYLGNKESNVLSKSAEKALKERQ